MKLLVLVGAMKFDFLMRMKFKLHRHKTGLKNKFDCRRRFPTIYRRDPLIERKLFFVPFTGSRGKIVALGNELNSISTWPT